MFPIDDTVDYLSEVDLDSPVEEGGVSQTGACCNASVSAAAVHNNIMPTDEVPCSEDDIDTLIEQGIGLPDQPEDDGIPTSANGTTHSR